MYSVYILKSQIAQRYYVGYSGDVEERLRKHNSGGTTSTRPDRPWKVVYTEVCSNKRAAWLRERQIKSYKSGEAFKKLINGGVA
ncbi:GIY-YIG nuclease family protein [Candidatus Kaiserbacteria bacterium]|nr:GIY-YIG nuclease family protein [Candidatus Kaiserbacteria bacterium]